MMFEPTRDAGLHRLASFVPNAGQKYQTGRNFDLSSSQPPAVSKLSPWLRHRLIGEWEVLNAVQQNHLPHTSIAYVQEVFWRGYFKGWLEQHPSVWTDYRTNLEHAQQTLPDAYKTAIQAETGIACFDHWCRELRKTGYLHNHARMWFASIWIFTLRLPWELGAAFFLDTLHDADPASNTLSWRWVAGLHTAGKHYLATAENIQRFTGGRFYPKGQLNECAEPLQNDQPAPFAPLRIPSAAPPEKSLRLITEEDCLLPLEQVSNHCGILGVISPLASAFAQAAVRNTVGPLRGEVYIGHNWSEAIYTAAKRLGTPHVVTAYVPNGFVKDGLVKASDRLAARGITLHQVLRPYDAYIWPHANKGFFKLKKQIPQILASLQV